MTESSTRTLRADVQALIAASARGISAREVLEAARERLELWRAAAERGVPDACFVYGSCHDCGVGVAADPIEARRWFTRAADAGSALGRFALGRCADLGDGTDPDPEQAMRLYRLAAEQGLSLAQCNLAVSLQQRGGEADLAEAVVWLQRAVDQGNAVAMCNLGLTYETGDGVDPNPEEAVRWYTEAVASGFAYACFCLGSAHADGVGLPSNQEEAVRWFRKGAEADDAASQVALAFALLSGEGTDPDVTEAASWLRRAADQGDPHAAHELAQLLRGDEGIPQDLERAFGWLLQAAEAGLPAAVYELGVAYARGDGVPRDLETAAQWLERAVDLRVDGAEETRMQVVGELVDADPTEALAQLLHALATDSSLQAVRDAAAGLMGATADLDPETLQGMLARLQASVTHPDPQRAAVAAVACGALVEDGADGRPALPMLTSRMETILTEAASDGEDSPAWKALDWFYRPLVAILSRDHEARAEVARGPLLALAGEIADRHPGVGHLHRLLRVMKVTLLVIDPVAVKGWRVAIRGVSDNFQLHLLLRHVLAGDLALEAPLPAAVATALGDGPQHTDHIVEGTWDLLSWTAVDRSGALPEPVDEDHWIWNEGVPAEVPVFDDEPVVLLGPATCGRSWNNFRTFDALHAEVVVTETLHLDNVAERLARMACA